MKEITTRITSNGRVTILIEVRRQLGIRATAKVTFVIADDGTVELRPMRSTVAKLRGVVPALVDRETIDFEDQIEEALEARAKEIVRRLTGR